MFDADEIRNALGVILAPRQVFEIRVLDGAERRDGRRLQWAGWFDDVAAVPDQLARLRGGWRGAYFIPNPCDPLLLHRCANTIEISQRNSLTTNDQIVARRWLLADFDPVVWGKDGPIKGIAATDTEKAAALERARHVAAELQARGWPAPAIGDSGNGAHLLWRVNLPATSPLPERFLRACARLWGDEPGKAGAWNRDAQVDVDLSVHNAARIWKLYGTQACKGSGIGDRPWRMARLLDVPPGGAEVLGESELLAWLDTAEAERPPVPAPVLQPATKATRAPSTDAGPPSGEIDACAMLRAAGLEPGAPHTRADGATFHDLAACPCDRREKGAFLSIAASGAVGLGCLHASCAFSTGKGSPGEHWKRWRGEHDPDYGKPHEPRANPRDFAERMAALSLGATAAEPEAPPSTTPPPPRDGRRRVNVAQDLRAVRDEVLEALASAPDLYVSQSSIARPDGWRMSSLARGGLDSAVVEVAEMVKWTRDRVTGELVARPDTLPIRVRGMLEELSPELQARFRVVEAVTCAPFFSPSGEAVTAPGYCADAKSLLVASPEIDPVPEANAAAAFAWLCDLVADFPFEAEAERDNFIGGLLVPMVRPMIAGPVPLMLIEANHPGTGKTLLANMIQAIYGLPAEVGTLPRDEHVLASLILSILLESKAVHVFDNVKHAVTSEAMDVLLTGERYTDRVLGASRSLSLAVRMLSIMTSNNARFSDDMIRRMFRVRLLWTGPGRPEDRTTLRHRHLLEHVAANRGAALSRMVQIVREWVDAGRPEPEALPVMGKFERFSEVIGGILWHAGARQWLGNREAAKEAVAFEDEWAPFVASWRAEEGHWGPRKAGTLYNLAKKHGHLGSILGGGRTDAEQISRLGHALRGRRDHVINGCRIIGAKDSTSGQWVFDLQAVALH